MQREFLNLWTVLTVELSQKNTTITRHYWNTAYDRIKIASIIWDLLHKHLLWALMYISHYPVLINSYIHRKGISQCFLPQLSVWLQLQLVFSGHFWNLSQNFVINLLVELLWHSSLSVLQRQSLISTPLQEKSFIICSFQVPNRDKERLKHKTCPLILGVWFKVSSSNLWST